jgi:DNA polymerase-3 subunit delta
MGITMQSIEQDIKSGEFSHIYLLYGEESYLRKAYRNKLKDALSNPNDHMNVTYYEGKETNPLEVIDLAETMPFLASHRLIMIENSGFFKNSCEQLADYLTDAAESTYFIFIEVEVDKRSKMFKTVKNLGRAVEMVKQDEQKLKIWAAGIIKRSGKNVRENTLNLLLSRTGTDMENLVQELEKLICYAHDREIIVDEDVEAICTTKVSNQIFDMVNCIAEKRQKRALELYYDLLSLKEPPMRILFLIVRQFNLLMQVKDLLQKTSDAKKIGEKTGLYGFIVSKYITQSKRFRMAELRQVLTDCIEAEEAVKTGKMNDVMSVELLIVKYSA